MPKTPAEQRPTIDLARCLETPALFVLLMVVALRPLVSESYASALNAIARVVEDRGNLTPAITAWFNLLIWLAAMLTLIAGLLRRRRWKWTGAELGAAMLLLAAVVSSLAADNKRMAINACGDWLTAIVLLITLVQLCRCRTRIVLVLVVVVASGVASAARSMMQVMVEYEETSQVYWESKDSFWANQGVRVDDPRVELYERRMLSREATGFLPYSNAQGALLAMAGFASLALCRLCHAHRVGRLVPAILALFLLATIWTTGSKGAMVAMGLMLLLWGGWSLCKSDLRPRWRSVWLGGWIAAAVFALLVMGYGWVRGGLPGASLNFRWHYWTVTTRVIAEYPWTGTGALNFDRAYMRHKPAIYPEEIHDPHNFIISSLAQGGPIGCMGLLLLMGGVSWVAAKRWGMSSTVGTIPNAESSSEPKSLARWMLAVPAGYVFLRIWLLRGFLGDPIGGWAYVYFDLGSYGLLWILTSIMLLRVASRPGDVGLKHYRPALVFGGLAFLLQNTVDFSFYVPGLQTVFVALVAILLAVPGEQRVSPGTRWGLLMPLALMAAGLLWFLVAVFVPVTRSCRFLEQARLAPAAQAEDLYRSAAQADPLDPTPWTELAAWKAQGKDYLSITRAIETMEHAIARSPKSLALYRFRAELYHYRYRHAGGPNTDLSQAIADGQKVVELYPESPDEHVLLADFLAKAVVDLGREDLREQAVWHYQEALRLDEERPDYEIRRWSGQRRREVQENLSLLRITLSTSSAPVKHANPHSAG
ncbi:MAG: O-antigen ligase family protein [Phycisphaerales bacterium]|nr:O-antigen ligase family protein [Phycisphaerales bacterium]